MWSRRRFVTSVSAGSAAALFARPYVLRGAIGVEPGRPLPIPPLLEPSPSAAGVLDAIAGTTDFLDGASTRTAGFGQSFLGPVIRVRRGQTAPFRVSNRLSGEAVTCHWHGLAVPGWVDGGPHQVIAPGAAWSPELEIDQPASTLWYHSHLHGRTADQVHAGLAGMLIVDDPDAPDPGLPDRWGIDDLPLILQDRTFASDGAFAYAKMGMTVMHGFRGEEMLVNGAIRPLADVPPGLTRLRLLNGSNARTFALRFEDGRTFHQVALGGGLMPVPVERTRLELPPAGRAEIVVDFGNGGEVALISDEDPYEPMRGMGMGGRMGRGAVAGSREDEAFEVMRFRPDPSRTASRATVPQRLAGAPAPLDGEPIRRRSFRLAVHGGGMGMGRMGGGAGGQGRGRGGGGMGGMGGGMTINGTSMDLEVINEEVRRGETELWEIISEEMTHPFHIHGGSFTVVSRDGQAVSEAARGLDDIVLVEGRAEVLVRFDHLADESAPYMYHCHILEHEDSGMMGQFTVV